MIVSVRSKSHGSDLGMVHEGFLSWHLQKEVKLKFDLTKSWCIFDVNREIELDLGYWHLFVEVQWEWYGNIIGMYMY